MTITYALAKYRFVTFASVFLFIRVLLYNSRQEKKRRKIITK